MAAKRDLHVTEPDLPPLAEFIPYLEEIWSSRRLTNAGPFHLRFEAMLSEYLDVDHLSLFANGTLALITALRALRLSGEAITTPFSFPATAHALLWNGIQPVFVDIDPDNLNLDPDHIEAAITPRTTAILPVHCFGRPCDTDAIQRIAARHGLKVIYDAAHAFGVRQRGVPILRHGDMSVLSFHATKVFNTFEGGAVISADAAAKQQVDYLKNFGFADEVTVMAAGINGKMNEFQAALGLLQLRHVDRALERRRQVDIRYRQGLADCRGITCLAGPADTAENCGYFPILVGDDYPLSRDDLYARLRREGIYARRYFYPLISDMPIYRHIPTAGADNLPVARKVAASVLCLPIFPSLAAERQQRVIDIILSPA